MKNQKVLFQIWRWLRKCSVIFFLLPVVVINSCKERHAGEFSGHLGHLAKLQQGDARRSSSAHQLRSSNRDWVTMPAGESHVLADIKGSGSIRHIWITFPAPDESWLCPDGCSDHGELVIRMYWDGADEPAVEAPIGDFFAQGFGIRAEVNSIPVMVPKGNSYNCFWIMPFHESARIEVENQSEKGSGLFYYHVDYHINEEHSSRTPYFCAQYRQKFPCDSGKDYLILDATGEGHYVGTVLSGRSRSPAWFGEGDEKFFIDGDTVPTIQGTGTEDFVLHAWGWNYPTTFPYAGVPIMVGPNRQVGWTMSMYRWHITDPIPFRRSLRVKVEDAGWMSEDEVEEGTPLGFLERNDDFASVAFWYQVGQPKRFTELPGAKDRKLPNLDIIIEGTELLDNARYSFGIDATIEEMRFGYPWPGRSKVNFSNIKPGESIEVDFYVKVEELRQLTLRMTKAIDMGKYRVYLNGDLITRSFRDVHYHTSNLDWYDFYHPYAGMTELGVGQYAIGIGEHTRLRSSMTAELSLGQYTLPEGRHTILFECIGKNSNSHGYGLGLESIRLRERWDKKRTAPADLYYGNLEQ